MGETATLLIASDIHYASNAEKTRADYECLAIDRPLLRLLIRCYRYFIWQRDPFAHNHLIRRVLNPPLEPDLTVLNGDYSCDSAFIGVADPAARASAAECLGLLRERFAPNLLATVGDHELGKVSLAGGKGGLRLESWRAAREDLALESFWTHRLGKYLLVGITSTLAALPVFEREALPEEIEEWRRLRLEHMNQINHAFESLGPEDRVILFCHDPTALPFLHAERPVWGRLPQIERTILGHLHTRLIFWESKLLAGMPPIRGCGTSIRRMTTALHEARKWKHFNPLLCPSLAGIELFKCGGFYTAAIDPEARRPAEFTLHRVPREAPHCPEDAPPTDQPAEPAPP